MKNANFKAHDLNLSCGDEIEIYLEVKDNKIKDAKFQAKGCAISIASADILLENIKNKSLNQIKNLTKEDLLKLLGIELTPTRLKCALLSLNTLNKAIKK